MIEMLPILMVILIAFAGFTGMTNALKRAQQNRSGAKPDAEKNRAEKLKKTAMKTEQPAFQTFDTTYQADPKGWDSQMDYHEGEDPCHDDMEPIVPSAEAEPGYRPVFRVNELAKGFVIGEILNRKKR